MPTRRAKKLTAFHFEKAGWLGEFEQGSAPRQAASTVVGGGVDSQDPFRKWLPLHRLMRQRRSGSSGRVYLTVNVRESANNANDVNLGPDPDDQHFDEFDLFYGDVAGYFGLRVAEEGNKHKVDFAFSMEYKSEDNGGGSSGLEAVNFTVRGNSVITAAKLAQLRQVMIDDFLHTRLLKSAPSNIQRCRTLPRDQNELQQGAMYSSNQM